MPLLYEHRIESYALQCLSSSLLFPVLGNWLPQFQLLLPHGPLCWQMGLPPHAETAAFPALAADQRVGK